MDIKTLKYFCAVYEEQSISAASKRCFVAQPSISTSLSQLEELLEVRLFMRHRKGVTATTEGKRFYHSAIKLLGEFDAMKALFKQQQEPIPLSLAIMPTIDVTMTEKFFRRIGAISDLLQLRLVDLSENADVRIISDHLRRKGERFIPLWNERYVLALPHGHPLTLQESISLSDLHGVRFIERCLCEIQDDVSGYLRKHDIQPITVAQATNETWAVSLVASELGVAVIPESSARDRENVITRPIRGLKLLRKVGIAYNPKAASSAGLQLLLEHREAWSSL